MEVLLSVTLIGILTGLSVPIYQTFQVKNDLVIAANTISQSFHRAQLLSQAMAGDTTSGVYVVSGGITVFRGSSYSARDSLYDEVFSVPISIAASGLQEVVFDKMSGFPQSSGTITLTSSVGKTINVVVNSKGMVNY